MHLGLDKCNLTHEFKFIFKKLMDNLREKCNIRSLLLFFPLCLVRINLENLHRMYSVQFTNSA